MNRFVLAALTSRSAATVLRPLTDGLATIFTLHRFADPDLGVPGHSLSALRANLAHLRRRGYRFCSLGDLLATLESGQTPLARSVVFTIDDGYEDAIRLGAPVFEEFDCPVHIFLTTGFVDCMLWLWWDKIEYIIDQTDRESVEVDLGAEVLALRWASPAERRAAAVELSESLKRVSEACKLAVLDWLSHTLDVPLPAAAPAAYAPLTWGSIRSWQSRGVTYGPHSVSHPILSKTPDHQAWTELSESWRRVREQVSGALPVFCYSNGYADDFSSRECGMLSRLGLRAAMTMDGRHVDRLALTRSSEARYRLPRSAYPEDRASLLRVVCGLERAASVVRGRAQAGESHAR